MKNTRTIFLLLAFLFLNACSQVDIEVENAYTPVRTENQKMFAAYLDIKNNTDEPLKLTNIKSSSFNSVMLHQSSVVNGMATMRHLESLVIPAKGKAKLEPNGKHIMLMGAGENLWDKQSFVLTLEFSNGTSIQQTILLKKPKKQ